VKSASLSEPTSRVRCNVCSVAFCNSSFLARFHQSFLSSLVYWNLFFLHLFVEIYSFFTYLLQSVLSLSIFVIYSFLFTCWTLFLLILAVYSFFHSLMKICSFFTRLSKSIPIFPVYRNLFFTHLFNFALSFTCLSGSALSSPIYWSLLFLHPFFAVCSFFTRFLKAILSSFVSYRPIFFIRSLLPHS